MSVELREEADGKVLILDLSGKLTKDDYAHFTPTVERAVKYNGKVRLLVRMHGFHGWTLGAAWEDVKFAQKHFGLPAFLDALEHAQPGWFEQDSWVIWHHAFKLPVPGLPRPKALGDAQLLNWRGR